MNPEIISFLRFWHFMLFHDDKIRSFIVTGGFLVLFNSEAHLLPCSMYAPDFTVSESRSYFIVEVLSLFTLFHEDKNLLLMVPYPSLLEFIHLRWSAFTRYHVCSWFHITNLEVTSFLRLCLFLYCLMMTKSIVWWLLTHRFWSSVFCEGQLSLVSMYPPVFTVRESRSCSIVEVLSLCTLFHVDKIHSLMFVDPLLLEFSHLRRSAFAWYHLWSWCHFWRV